MYRTANRKPRNAQGTRKCAVCKRIVFWFVPDGPLTSTIVKHPRFGVIGDRYYCKDHRPPKGTWI